MEFKRTPDERFQDLPDWPYEPRYTETSDGLRIHYVDEGPAAGPLVVLAHGEPTWSYLYRKMIPLLVRAGCRALAFDLVGFGRSDKPAAREDYTYRRHLGWFGDVYESLDLREATLFCQDWGGIIGLAHAVLNSGRYRGVVVSNAALPMGQDMPVPEAFDRWLEFSQLPEFSAGEIVGGDSSPLNQIGYVLSEEEKRAYDAPFPDESYRAGARQFPLLVPKTYDHPSSPLGRELWDGPVQAFETPVLTAFGELDTATIMAEPVVQTLFKGAVGRPHRTIEGAAHFVQEHAPEACVQAILDLLEDTA